MGCVRVRHDILLFSAWGRQANWCKNVVAAPDQVSLQIGLRHVPVRAQVLDDPAQIRGVLAQFIAESPAQAKQLLGWEPGRDRLEAADFSPFVQQVLIVRFAPL
ncbi:MAG: hypothetical protein NTY23_15335 [Chloroflexi bacterium]|nr:hypothetical protein [Chloroflexota bacterium]